MATQYIETDNFIANINSKGDAYYIHPIGNDHILAEVERDMVALCSCPFFTVNKITDLCNLIKECSEQFMEVKKV